jgi:hypothetical protein
MTDYLEDYAGPRYATDDADGFSNNPFENATQIAGAAQRTVIEQLGYIKTKILGTEAADSINMLNTQLGLLGAFEVDMPPDLKACPPDFLTGLQLNMDISDIDKNTFGQITSYTPGVAPTADTFPTVDDPNIPSFSPSIVGINVPAAPNPSNIALPGDGPDSPVFVYPDEVDITLPDEPSLLGIVIPPTPDVEIPTLDLSTFPTLAPLSIDTFIDWTEPTYAPEIWTNVKTQILTFLNGGTGIRPDVEEAIVNRGRDREDRIVRQQVQEAMEEWASRGYTAPPGMLAKRIDTIREEGTLKKLGLQREVVIKTMEEELTNLRFAVQQGIAAEDLFIRLHLAAVERTFQVQRLHVEWQIQVYNLTVQAYQARLQENLIRAQVYEVQVRAALAEIEIFKALIEAETLKTEVNKNLVDIYTAQIQARESLVNMYTAQVGAVKVRAEVFATQVGAYRAEVEAYAAKVGADKLRFDAYESRVKGETAKADIIEAEARAYQAEVQGIDTGVRAQVAALEGAVSKFRADVEAYDAQLRGYVALNQNELSQIQANVEGHRLDVQRFVAESGVEVEANRLEATVWEAENRIELEAYRAEIERIRIVMEKAIQESTLMLESIKASGDLASTISAGALAAMHVGATTAGNGTVNAAGQDSVGFSWREARSKACNRTHQTSISFDATDAPNLECDF